VCCNISRQTVRQTLLFTTVARNVRLLSAHTLKNLLHSSESSMTLWSMTSCQTSNKCFSSSSMLCSCDWCTRYRISPHILQSTGLTSVLFGGHRSGGIKAAVDCSNNRTFYVFRVRMRCLVERWRNRTTSRISRATAAVTGARRGNGCHWSSIKDEVCEAKPWDTDGCHNR